MPKELQLTVPKVGLMKMAEQEGAEAARRGRARGSNPYPVSHDVILRQHWFLGYDQLLADLIDLSPARSR